MRAIANKKILAPLAALAAVAGFAVVGASTPRPAPVAIDLCASDGHDRPAGRRHRARSGASSHDRRRLQAGEQRELPGPVTRRQRGRHGDASTSRTRCPAGHTLSFEIPG